MPRRGRIWLVSARRPQAPSLKTRELRMSSSSHFWRPSSSSAGSLHAQPSASFASPFQPSKFCLPNRRSHQGSFSRQSSKHHDYSTPRPELHCARKNNKTRPPHDAAPVSCPQGGAQHAQQPVPADSTVNIPPSILFRTDTQ
ncbi:hypothetical protein BV25DRAFT_1827225 [Artomyces pyxidatus]|uniref:Uncharacterized protein n=1 Tax=Artomyces pyxidatus TaxID=48021 RepID=A0ACB8SWW0_9AGAM|nr:hypothetical protein BV25DRAFT_1827225 [Artomyces pyxidatus]